MAGHDVRLYDAPAAGMSLDDVLAKLRDFVPDLMVVDSSTPSIHNDIDVLERLKMRFPRAFALLVGTHPSALPRETLELSAYIDGIAVGEYDYTVRDLSNALENASSLNSVAGLAHRSNGDVLVNDTRGKIEDLDSIPFVSSIYKRHLHYRNYFFAAASYPMLMIITGRGCPFKCFFCVYPQVFHGRKYRMRSPENVVEEFDYIQRNFPEVKEIGIEDDCFTANPRRVAEICELLIRKKIKVKWYCNVRGDLDYSLLRVMKQAGCRLVTVGFESGCQSILDNMHKGEKVESYYRFANDAKRAGILIHGCIMVGNPGDSRETLAKSYEFAKKINCDSMQFYPLYVYPGTEAFNWASGHGFLRTRNFSEWLTPEGLHNCVLDIPGLNAGEMVELCDHYLKKYHLRPSYLMMKLLQAVTNPSEGYRSLKSARTFFQKYITGQLGKSF